VALQQQPLDKQDRGSAQALHIADVHQQQSAQRQEVEAQHEGVVQEQQGLVAPQQHPSAQQQGVSE
jgi:hypothetical protein